MNRKIQIKKDTIVSTCNVTWWALAKGDFNDGNALIGDVATEYTYIRAYICP